MRQRFKLLIVTFETFVVGLLASLVLGLLGFMRVALSGGQMAARWKTLSVSSYFLEVGWRCIAGSIAGGGGGRRIRRMSEVRRRHQPPPLSLVDAILSHVGKIIDHTHR